MNISEVFVLQNGYSKLLQFECVLQGILHLRESILSNCVYYDVGNQCGH